MGKLYKINFSDSTEHAKYQVMIFSENDEEYEQKNVSDYTVRQIMELLENEQSNA